MPANDTQSLLKLNPVQPNSPSTQRQPDFISSQISGGQIQIGQPTQQVGPTGETAMYGALAEIAGGVQKSVGNFIDIASGMEKEKIKQAETFFEQLSTKEDLTPDEKQSQYDAYMAETWTPVLGNDWKAKMSVAMNKTWTSREARDKYEASRYERDYSAWKDRKENQGRTETNEVIQEFNSLYVDAYPSAKENTWYRQLSTKVNTTIDIANAQQAVIDFRDSLEMSFPMPTTVELEAYANSGNMEANYKFEKQYASFFEMKKKVDTTNDTGEINSFIYKYIVDTILEPKRATLEPYAFELIHKEIDQLAFNKTKQMISMIRSENVSVIKQQAITNIASYENNFRVDKNTSIFLSGWTRNVGNLPPEVRSDQKNALLGTVYNSIAENNSAFKSLRPDEQTQVVANRFNEWYSNANPGEQAAFAKATGIDTPEKLNQFISSGLSGLLANEKQAGGAVTAVLNNMTKEGQGIGTVFPVQDAKMIQDSMDQYRTDTSRKLGISVESLEALSFSRDGEGQPMYSAERTIQDWYDADLSVEEKKALTDRGFTADGFKKLEAFRLQYIELEVLAKKSSIPNSKSGSSSGSLPFNEKSDPEITTALIMDKATMAAAYVTRNSLRNKTPKELEEMDSAEFAAQNRVAVLLTTLDTEFKIWMDNRGGITGPKPQGFSLDSEGTLIPEAVSPSNSQRRLSVDKTGSLDNKGKGEYLRLQFAAAKLARLEPNNSERTKFQGELKTLLTQLSTKGIRYAAEREPAKVYALAATLAGLSEGDPTGINATIFTGMDQNIMKIMSVLVKTAARHSGGILDVSGGDELSEDQSNVDQSNTISIDEPYQLQNADRNKRIEAGTVTELDQPFVGEVLNNPIRKISNAWSDLVSATISPLSAQGESQILPLVPSSNPDRDKLVSVNSEVANVVAAFTKSGSSAYRNDEIVAAFVRRMNFTDVSGSDGALVGAFGNALWNVTGQSLPAMSDNESSVSVKVATTGGFMWKPWNNLSQSDKVGAYLALWSSTDPTSVEAVLSGWIHQADNPNTKAIRTMEFFQESASYIAQDIIKPYSNPTMGVQTSMYYNRSFETTRNQSSILPFFGTPGENRQTTNVVRDGNTVHRGDLLTIAKALSFDEYQIGSDRVKKPWTNIGTPTEVAVPVELKKDGTMRYAYHNVILGEVKSEDQYVLTAYLSQEMTNQDYKLYEWWAKTLGQTPKKEDEYLTAVTNFKRVNRTLPGGFKQSVTTEVQPDMMRNPAVFTIISVLHNVDLTSPDVGINVDGGGNMSFEIGNVRYSVKDRPPNGIAEGRTNYASENDVKAQKERFTDNKDMLERERANKRVQARIGVPVLPYVPKQMTADSLAPKRLTKLANSPEARKNAEESRIEEEAFIADAKRRNKKAREGN